MSPALTRVHPAAPSMVPPSGLVQRKCACGGSDYTCEQCKKKNTLQRQAAGGGGPTLAPPIVDEVLRSAGQPLDPETRAFMESRFGHDFSRMRIHATPRAAESARAVNALAYTVGREVVFGAGQYAPRNKAGARLLAHELTHVVQQGEMPLSGVFRVSGWGERSEREADEAAQRIVAGARVNPLPRHAPLGLQRKIMVDKPGETIPNPSGKGLNQTNAETVEQYLRTLCSGGNVSVDRKSGEVKMAISSCDSLRTAPGEFGLPGPTATQVSKEPTGCTCLCDLVHPEGRSEHEWIIKVNDKDFPYTHYDGDPEAMGGTGGFVTTISPNSPKVLGAVTQAGKRVDVDPWLILGHELCGHAWLGNFGMAESALTQEMVGRQPYTVDRENALRAEHGIEARGRSFKDPFCGESYFRFKGARPGQEVLSQMKECKLARGRCKKPGGGTFKLDERIPETASCDF